MAFDRTAHKYLRKNFKMPTIWCSGCGIGIILGSIFKALEDLNMTGDNTVFVGGIGCSSRIPFYVDFDALHTTHGRPIAFATGVKFAKPDLNVVVVAGDGDTAAIGGNHFIHACRRNIDITLIVINNKIYGMTGGQYSPTTKSGEKTTTSPYGHIERSFDISKLAAAAGATYVARSSVYHVTHLDKIIKEAFAHKGMSVVEIMSPCWTTHGRRNRFKTPVEMYKWLKDNMIPLNAWEKLPEDKRAGKIPYGVFVNKKDIPEYCEAYYEHIIKPNLNKKRRDFSEDIEAMKIKLEIKAKEGWHV